MCQYPRTCVGCTPPPCLLMVAVIQLQQQRDPSLLYKVLSSLGVHVN